MKLNFNFEKIKKLKEYFLEKIEKLRLLIGTHPRFVIFRLELFRWFPFLSRHIFKFILTLVIFLIFFFGFYIFSWRAPRPFPDHILVTVERGQNLGEIAKNFENKNVILSDFWLKFFITIFGGQTRVVAGDYYFPEPKNIFSIAWTLHSGNFGLIPIRVTIPEGLSSYEIAEILEKDLPVFDGKEFVLSVDESKSEGYLFPDTYFFMPNTKAGDVILTMRENFARQIVPYEEDIKKSERTLDELVIMASIIEDEANSSIDEKRIVSGILWKRIRIDMPLQVDAPFKYYNGKNSYTLTKDDLKEEHPYNTYVNKGLTPTAISNPGIDSIRASIAPTNTEYLYFMSDKKGNMYYAKDFDGHQINRERYLR